MIIIIMIMIIMIIIIIMIRITDFGGFDSSGISTIRGGILMSTGHFLLKSKDFY